MLRFLDQGASIDVPDGFVDKSVYTATDATRRVLVRPCPGDCSAESACVDAVIDRLQQTLGSDVTLSQRGAVRVGEQSLACAELEARVMGQDQWLQLLSGRTAQCAWLMQISAPKADHALVQDVLDTLRDTASVELASVAPQGAARRFFAGSICFELPTTFASPWAAGFETEGGVLSVQVDGQCPPPEEVFYSAPPLEQLEQLRSKLDTPLGAVWIAEQTVRTHTPQGSNKKVHLAATLGLPERAALFCVAAGDLGQRLKLDTALRHLLNSVRIAKRHG